MNDADTLTTVRRRFFRDCLRLSIGALLLTLTGCAAPLWAKSRKRKPIHDKFSCGEECHTKSHFAADRGASSTSPE